MSQARSSYAVIVDDHPLSLKGLQQFVAGLCVVGRVLTVEGADGIDRLIAENGRPRLALVDFWLADGPATAILRRLQIASPTTRLVVISSDDRPVVLNRARALGVHGFISRKDSTRDYRNALLAVLAGRTWFEGGTALAGGLPGARPPAAAVPAPRPTQDDTSTELTPRQRDVLALLLQGQPNKMIAQLLQLSEYTVKEHVSAILRKHGANSRIELIMCTYAEREARAQQPGGQETV